MFKSCLCIRHEVDLQSLWGMVVTILVCFDITSEPTFVVNKTILINVLWLNTLLIWILFLIFSEIFLMNLCYLFKCFICQKTLGLISAILDWFNIYTYIQKSNNNKTKGSLATQLLLLSLCRGYFRSGVTELIVW